MVEAYLERSEEARRIVAQLEALKQLSDESVLNPKADYWEKSAARIETAIGNSARSEIEPVKRSAWSEWGWKAVSLAASVVMLTYVGFHSGEIFEQLRERPQTENLIQEKARSDPSIQRFDPSIKKSDKKIKKFDSESTPKRLDDKGEPIRRKKWIAKPTPVPKPATETDRRRVAPVPLMEPEAETVEEAVTLEPLVEPDDEGSQYKEERIGSKSVIRSSADGSANMVSKGPTVGLTTVSNMPIQTVDSFESEPVELELASDISSELDEAGEGVAFYDSTKAEVSETEQFQYLWDHVILHKLTALKAAGRKVYSYRGVGQTLSLGLQDQNRKSDSKATKKRKMRAIEREHGLIDAAFFVGSRSLRSREYYQAVKFLKFMATGNDEILDSEYARKKLKELKEMR